jgi:hypothetical protein
MDSSELAPSIKVLGLDSRNVNATTVSHLKNHQDSNTATSTQRYQDSLNRYFESPSTPAARLMHIGSEPNTVDHRERAQTVIECFNKEMERHGEDQRQA